MKLNKKSLLIKWAYLPDLSSIPDQTDVCSLFWRTVFMSPLFCLTVAFICCLLSPILIPILIWIGFCKLVGINPTDTPKPIRAVNDFGTLIKSRVNDWKRKTCSLVILE